MKQEITLYQYIKLGGDLSKIDWNESYLGYSGDRNYKQKIVSCEDKSETNQQGEPLIHFTFENGNTHRYAISWVKINVELVLHNKYKK